MYVVTVLFETPLVNADAFREAVLQQAQTSLRAEPDCHQFDVSERSDESEGTASFFLYEKYRTRDAFDAHLATPHFHDFDQRVSGWVSRKTVDTWQEVCV